jgi:cell division septation protein DedD
LYRKAQAMVANGDATAGRALVDSLMHATSPDSVSYANGLYWQAVLASSAADAELDYRRIVVDYPTSPRVDDALLRIGQLELTRGEYDEALQHLRRVPAEHPSSPLRAKASYWIARTLFEKNDLPDACAANADAAAHISPSDVELKNQIDYQQPQCRGVAIAPPQETPGTPATAVATPQVVASSSKPAVEKKHTKTAEVPAKIPPPTTPAAKSAEGSFTVQVAAYYDRGQAEGLATKLQARGYTTARVEGTKAPYRVRLGHFKTHAAAVKLLATLQAKKMTGFVAEE